MAEVASDVEDRELTLDILERLKLVCERHLNRNARRNIDPQQSDCADASSDVISSVLYDFSTILQHGTSYFNSFDVLQASLEKVRFRREAIKYCMWNRLPHRKYQNVYYQLMARRLGADVGLNGFCRDNHIRRSCKLFQRGINIWGHHQALAEVDMNKAYNEPPQVHVLKYDKTGNVLITGGDEGIIKLWHAFTGKLIMSLKRHTGGVACIDVHASNVFIVSCCDGGELWLWEINGNHYRPHKMIKIGYKFLWVQFITGSKDTCQRPPSQKFIDSIESTLIVCVSADSKMRIYRMMDLLTPNVYADVVPLYQVDLFNHNIKAYDVSVVGDDGKCLIALGIEPWGWDLEDAHVNAPTLDEVTMALCIIKNDAIFKPSTVQTIEVEGEYNKLTNVCGNCLFVIDVPLPRCACCCFSCTRAATATLKTGKKRLRKIPFGVKSSKVCKDLTRDRQDTSNGPFRFLWLLGTNDLEQFLQAALPNVPNKPSVVPPDHLRLNETNMPIGRLTSTVMYRPVDAQIELSPPAAPMGTRDFDELIYDCSKDLHASSPDVCFANYGMDHITASDDGSLYLWKFVNDTTEGFKEICLRTKTLDKWQRQLKDELIEPNPRASSNEKLSACASKPKIYHDCLASYEPSEPIRADFMQGYKEIDACDEAVVLIQHDSGEDGNNGKESKKGVSGGGGSSSRQRDRNYSYVVTEITWSCHDVYIYIADALVTPSNVRKMITSARTAYCGVSSFNAATGERICDFLHTHIDHYVSSLRPHPKSEEILVVLTYSGDVFLASGKCGILHKIPTSPHAVWLDAQWHPDGLCFAASQKYGCFSIFTMTGLEPFRLTSDFQCAHSDYYCNPGVHGESVYATFSSEENADDARFYFGYSPDPPLVIQGYKMGSRVYSWNIAPFETILDDTNGTRQTISPQCLMEHSLHPLGDILARCLQRLPCILPFQEFMDAHVQMYKAVDETKLITWFLSLKINFIKRKSSNDSQSCHCPSAGFDCSICSHVLGLNERVAKCASVSLVSSGGSTGNFGVLARRCRTTDKGDILAVLPPAARPQGPSGSRLETTTSGEQVEQLTTASAVEESQGIHQHNGSYSLVDASGRSARGGRGRSSSSRGGTQTIGATTRTSAADSNANVNTTSNEYLYVMDQEHGGIGCEDNDDEDEDDNDETEEEEDDDDDEDADEVLRSSYNYRDEDDEDEELDEDLLLDDDDEENEENDDEDEDEDANLYAYDEQQRENQLDTTSIGRQTRHTRSHKRSRYRDNSAYTFRERRGATDTRQEREMELARQITSSLGSVHLYRLSGEDGYREVGNPLCVFCRLGDWHQNQHDRLRSRLQQRNLASAQSGPSTLKELNGMYIANCKLAKNYMIGPLQISRRYSVQFQELPTVLRRIENTRGELVIYAHAACVASATFAKTDSCGKRIVNLPELLVRSSHVTCDFCRDTFPTLHCTECQRALHYSCASAALCSLIQSIPNIEMVHVPDPLFWGALNFVCPKCCMRSWRNGNRDGYLSFITGEAFLDASTRSWLRVEGPGNGVPQVGDFLLVMKCGLMELNNVTQLNIKPDPSHFMRIEDVDYAFTAVAGYPQVVALLSGFNLVAMESITMFMVPYLNRVLFTDILHALWRCSKLAPGDKIRVFLDGNWVETKVKGIKPMHGYCTQPLNRDDPVYVCRICTHMVSNAVSVDPLGKCNKTWFSGWDVEILRRDKKRDVEIEILQMEKQLREKTLPPAFVAAVIEELQDPRYAMLATIPQDLDAEAWVRPYWLSIPNPIGYVDIVARLTEGYYRRMDALVADVALAAHNAMQFNGSDSEAYRLASRALDRVKDIHQRFNNPPVPPDWRLLLDVMYEGLEEYFTVPRPSYTYGGKRGKRKKRRRMGGKKSQHSKSTPHDLEGNQGENEGDLEQPVQEAVESHGMRLRPKRQKSQTVVATRSSQRIRSSRVQLND